MVFCSLESLPVGLTNKNTSPHKEKKASWSMNKRKEKKKAFFVCNFGMIIL